LNNAIKKYGKHNFELILLETCPKDLADEKEIYHIKNENSLYPYGYNLTKGGAKHNHSNESKKRVSNGLVKYYLEKKFSKYNHLNFNDIDINNIKKYIHPLKRNNKQFGWYIVISKIKTDFAGVHISIEDSYNNAINFIIELKKRLAKHLDAGNSLEL
jgi:hypothetical protein